jgi:hypothetical protein
MRRLLALPWQRWADPSLPFFYRLKRRLRTRLGSRRGRQAFRNSVGTATWLLGCSLPALYSFQHFSGKSLTLALPLSAALSGVWILPIPFLFFALLAIATLEAHSEEKAMLILTCWWTATFLSTLWGRFFPGLQRDWARKRAKPILPCFGKRQFILALGGWASASSSAHLKLLSQSLYFTPLPWIILVHGVLATPVVFFSARLLDQLR